MATVRELDVIQNGSGEPFVVLRINDCRASCVSLRGRRWDDPEVVIKTGEPTFGISINTEISDFTKLLGKFPGVIEVRKKVLIDRTKREPEFVYVPMPGTAPKKKRRRPMETSVPDDDHTQDGVVDLLKSASDKITSILSDPTE